MRYKFTGVAVLWHDKVNGNTYHSVRIIRHRDRAVLYVPFQYGYGHQYRLSALEAMSKAGWIPEDGHAWERNGYPILWVSYSARMKDCIANGGA